MSINDINVSIEALNSSRALIDTVSEGVDLIYRTYYRKIEMLLSDISLNTVKYQDEINALYRAIRYADENEDVSYYYRLIDEYQGKLTVLYEVNERTQSMMNDFVTQASAIRAKMVDVTDEASIFINSKIEVVIAYISGLSAPQIDKAMIPSYEKSVAHNSPYSKAINRYISNLDELRIYLNANLREMEVDGRLCLIRTIDYNYVDDDAGGKTNRELMMDNGDRRRAQCPIDALSGERIELHHIGQNYDSPFAELTEEEHDKYTTLLHKEGDDSWRRDPEKKNMYNNNHRPFHWFYRACMEDK